MACEKWCTSAAFFHFVFSTMSSCTPGPLVVQATMNTDCSSIASDKFGDKPTQQLHTG